MFFSEDDVKQTKQHHPHRHRHQTITITIRDQTRPDQVRHLFHQLSPRERDFQSNTCKALSLSFYDMMSNPITSHQTDYNLIHNRPQLMSDCVYFLFHDQLLSLSLSPFDLQHSAVPLPPALVVVSQWLSTYSQKMID